MAFLSGYRLLDMAWLGPGPFCAQILGDLGMDVVKISAVPDDSGRRGGRSVLPGVMVGRDQRRNLGARNARSLCLNLKTDEGKAVFRRLVERADALQEGFRPGVADRLGVGYEAVRAIKPDIVYASISGYGQDGPYRNRAGHDVNYLSVAGFIHVNGRAGGPPAIPGTVVADYAAGGMSAVVHILAGLLRRERTGQGTYADVSMTDAVFEINSVPVATYLSTGVEPRRGELMLSGYWPWYDLYETQDGGYISVAAVEPWFYETLCKVLGREDLVDKQWSEEHRQEVRQAFTDIFKSRPRDEWTRLFADVDACVVPVQTVGEAVQDPQLRFRGMLREVDHPVHGRVTTVGSMIRFDGQKPEPRRWALVPGQHTDEILAEHGYSEAEIAELRERRIIA